MIVENVQSGIDSASTEQPALKRKAVSDGDDDSPPQKKPYSRFEIYPENDSNAWFNPR